MLKDKKNLPGATTIDNLNKLINILKRKNGTDKDNDVKTLFNMGSGTFSSTKSALKAFGLFDHKAYVLTKHGNKIAYCNEEQRKEEFGVVCKRFSPYELYLLGILESNDSTAVTTLEEVINFFGRNDLGTTERNREDASKMFLGILEYIGLGRYIKGKGNHPTRFEWKESKLEDLERLVDENVPDLEEFDSPDFDSKNKRTNVEMKSESSGKRIEDQMKLFEISNVRIFDSLEIKVDISDWDIEQIRDFFKLLKEISNEE